MTAAASAGFTGCTVASILVLQHVECEDIGSIRDAIERRGLGTAYARAYRGEASPASLGDHRALIVMGGPMSVYERDRYPHLTGELRLIRRTIQEGRPVLGICLGSQLIAEALGGKVSKGQAKEIGWYAVRKNPNASQDPLFAGLPGEFPAFHWHGDVFTLPPGAVPLASSERTPLQAFRYGASVYAILFHLEVTPESVEGMLRVFAQEIQQEGLSADALQHSAREHAASLAGLASTMFEGWMDLVQGKAAPALP